MKGDIYMGSGDPARGRIDSYAVWLDNLADDVTRERAAMEGAAQGAEAVRTIVVTARELYEHQEFNYAGPTATTASTRCWTALSRRRRATSLSRPRIAPDRRAPRPVNIEGSLRCDGRPPSGSLSGPTWVTD